jgi:hypothetical protein
VVLPYAAYAWKVRALVGGVWKTFSALKTFTLLTVASITPVPQTPIGVITDDTPTYTWTKVGLATQYQLYLYKGTTLVYAITVPGSACGTKVCSSTPVVVLLNAAYNWKIRALVSGIWRIFSVSKYFTMNAPASIPSIVTPWGTTYGRTPSYTWTKITGATSYQYNLYQGATLVYTKTVAAASVCGTKNCLHTPVNVLSLSTLYTWKVRALLGGTWRAYSTPRSFILLPVGPAFSSNFTSDALGWTPVWGTWQFSGAAYYTTPGVSGTFSSIIHNDQYATMTYEARMERLGTCTECGSYLIFRGVASPIAEPDKSWSDSLLFEYSNNGSFMILQTNSGAPSRFVDWTDSPAIIRNNWNVLKVVANYNYMSFYINNTLVWSGNIPTAKPVGQVGIGMFSKGLTGDKLYVDYATLTTTAAAASSTDIAVESSQPQFQEVTGTEGADHFGVSP